ncbi:MULTISPECIES: neuraminidase-like domain-containing protein [unclassified Bacillus cereus group]|uniref:Tc toxin subunit A-related protein n=1 Tax=unclassified Bacillus cereus group TaxID=2750818 RepID=UPI0011EF0E37|nr:MULTISPECIES: neuraminidase-like domain-containing protein [unclassified Bacillus cereus group]QEL71780.1 insecticidal toxin complex protein [Bacillus sp. AR4-2]QEL77058.1 insecticidal toxin complex protein [Bacillus sp. SH8-8]
MPKLLVIRLHPVEPIQAVTTINGESFDQYLKTLSIKAVELSFNDPNGSGTSMGLSKEYGPAKYIEPTVPLLPSPTEAGARPNQNNSQIIQHFEIVEVLSTGPIKYKLNFFAVATAVIEIPDPLIGEEYLNADVRLVIERNNGDIVHKQKYYNVPLQSANIPSDPNDFQTLETTSLYLTLPSPGQQLSPTVTLPEDGTAPNFENLRTAVENVLKAEPGSTVDIANLTRDKCRHIAYEIIWGPMAYPLPVPMAYPLPVPTPPLPSFVIPPRTPEVRKLEEMYTDPQGTNDEAERDRKIFEGELLAYYAKHNSEAERLANFVFSLSAAIWCEEESKKATQAGYYFPVFLASPVREAKVILRGAGTVLEPVFWVPAAYFYVFTAVLSSQVKREQRFKMTVLIPEEQIVANIEQALDDQVLKEPTGVNRFQAARRLRALGSVGDTDIPIGEVTPATPFYWLVSNWLDFTGADINSFWGGLSLNDIAAHFDLVVFTVTKGHVPLMNAINSLAFGVKDVKGLAAKNSGDWETLLYPDSLPASIPDPLPGFTNPGTRQERIQAFINHLRKFFDIEFKAPAPLKMDFAPTLDRPADNPLDRLLKNYPGKFLFSGWDPILLEQTLSGIFPGDLVAQQQFTEWLECIQGVINLTSGITPVDMQFSVMEALWARGFTDAKSIKGLTFEDFKEALVGSKAYDYAKEIWTNSGAVEPSPVPGPSGFKPINPDGSLINCIPPANRSPLGPIAYLHDLLKVSIDLTCKDPIPKNVNKTLATFLASRRGPLGNLLATQSNLAVPLPLIDIVNESLEYIVANNTASGMVYNTAQDKVGDHELTTTTSPTGAFQHDPVTLFEALPEHSTPAVLTDAQTAYDILKNDFTACWLPYSQPLDVVRTYLKQLGTSRFATMRRFRKAITEFVLDPAKEPAKFQSHLWRYPVRIETAIEYLGITPEEYQFLFQKNISSKNLYKLYGFKSDKPNGILWTNVIVHVAEFLKRTCLSYCEFIELWKSEFVKFSLKGSREKGFPDCEPCCLDEYVIEFEDPANPAEALKQLAVFIRIWRKMQSVPNARYTFTELRDICKELELFQGPSINPDFIRQLAAFQMFRDDFHLSLTDGTKPHAGETGAERLHLLAFWVKGATKWNWALEHLLHQIQQYAIHIHNCRCREPEFLKLLIANLNPLSVLAGFNPSNPIDSWHAHPTHTLRFAEILVKIYASEFKVGELLFLFTNEEHLQGDDPFPLQTANEAKDSPLGLPDDEDRNSLWTLRKKLLAVNVNAEASKKWTWMRMETVLREEFGYTLQPASNKWLSLGQHFFPSVLEDNGISVSSAQRQYRVKLPISTPTSELMWNTPPDGPFHYDASAQELWTEVPLSDEAVLTKISRIRQLKNPKEQGAVRDLYFLPRIDLANFAFLFNNFGEAEERLIQETEEAKRWAWFQQQFALFYQRCQIVAEHLALHIADATGNSNPEGSQLAKLLLKNLWADENRATSSWENDNGQSPSVTWQSQPKGGALAALLGLTGTGMLAEYFDAEKTLQWREVRGGLDAFGTEENAWNAPIPVIVPAMGFSFTPEQLRFAAVRNGFAMANADGKMLGGAEPFTLRWKGLLLIENEGQYEFSTGAPTPTGQMPDFKKAEQSHRWRVILKRGQKTWVLLSHDWPNEEAPEACTKPIALKTGFYELDIELERKPLVFDGPEDVCPQTTGFQLKYKGTDSEMEWLTVPYDKLFQDKKDATLQLGIDVIGSAKDFLTMHFTSTVRDIRRTYQRAFKAMLLASRLRLSVQRISDDGQSELGYILSHPVNFAGQAYYRSGSSFITHKANFDLNFLPVLDNYTAPSSAQDLRVAPTPQRMQAMFDWWERLFDYTVMRKETQRSPEQPAWLLFHESAELHEDKPAQLVRHLGIDLRHDTLVLQYYAAYEVKSVDLEDDRWAVRVWQSEKWIRSLQKHFSEKEIWEARPDLWASDDPAVPETAFNKTESGNLNLARFYREGCIENGEPRRYEEIKRLNDGLRERGRAALVAYLTHMDRVLLPWGGFATEVKHLSELLLMDVEVGICQKASRIEEAISAVQLFIQRARLGLEPAFVVSQDFILAWDRHFATYCIWETCKRRDIYRENWVEWDEWQKAKRTEAFQFLESELRSATLTMPVPGGLTYWNGLRPPAHPGITPLQHREPSTIQFLDPVPEGLGLMGTPDRHARPTWLAPLRCENNNPGGDDSIEVRDDNPNPSINLVTLAGQTWKVTDLPMWLQATVRLGTKFYRVAAAGIPPATTTFESKCNSSESSACCNVCGKTHPALMDEYYFWIEESRYYNQKEQVAEWGASPNDPQTDWYKPEKLPEMLHWVPKPMVHLRWCRLHNGEFQQPQKSYEGVQVTAGSTPELVFLGRRGDSLHFEITGGEVPAGYVSPPPPPPGFRYDIATDEAITLPAPLVIPITPPVGELAAFPFFAWFDPGTPLLPPSLFSPAIAVAGHLRAHCRFEAALKWYELVYNPLVNDNTWLICPPVQQEPGISIRSSEGFPVETAAPHSEKACCCASTRVSDAEVIKERAILMHYLDTQLQWGDALMRKNTPEDFQQARLIFDTAAKILGDTPITVLSKDEDSKASTVTDFEPDCAPINPRLMCLYTSVNDRLSLIHSCLNAKRLKNGRPNLDMPYFGNSGIRDCWKNTNEVCTDEGAWCLSQSPYRYMVLVQKAQELAGDVRAFGSALLAGYEKGDAEYLSTIRTMHEQQLLNLVLEVRQNQWREADWQVQALQKTKQIAQTRLQYYQKLIANGLISGEAQHEPLTKSSTTYRAEGNVSEGTGYAMDLIPDPYVGMVNFIHLPPGTKMSRIFSALGRIFNTIADIRNTEASLGLTNAGWERRKQEWSHQVDVLTIEIEQIERQILAAKRRSSIALRELNNHQQQIENAAEVHDFLRDKFTNHELYLWMQQETAAMYYQMYEIALHYAHQAQRAFNFERGHTARQFIPAEIWDNLHEGILAGERLQLALRHMEKAYYDENVREYELTKHISLRLHFPMAFLQLQTTGYCEIDIPEWMFDFDYPGHYMRRIKNVTMTIPCMVGPYTGVHCRLTLLSSKTRVDPRLVDPPHTCCHDERWKNGYQVMPEDTRIVSTYAATEAIATSSGQNDSGMFELNFRDERYLPFEFSGAVSRWRIELPLENNQFDMETLSDVILHLNFTAREGGENLRKAANECAQQNLPGAGVRFFDVKREFPEAWHVFTGAMPNYPATKQLGIQLSRSMFPYLTGNKKIGVTRIEILFEAPGADPSAHHIVEFLVGQRVGQIKEEKCDCNVHSISCVADANWPGLFHGVLEVDFEALSTSDYQELGVFRFPMDVGEITNTYLFCSYERL